MLERSNVLRTKSLQSCLSGRLDHRWREQRVQLMAFVERTSLNEAHDTSKLHLRVQTLDKKTRYIL